MLGAGSIDHRELIYYMYTVSKSTTLYFSARPVPVWDPAHPDPAPCGVRPCHPMSHRILEATAMRRTAGIENKIRTRAERREKPPNSLPPCNFRARYLGIPTLTWKLQTCNPVSRELSVSLTLHTYVTHTFHK